ncbi:MAG: hypothetical protein ABJC89_16975 [Acidobacteriota bacterium]
MAEDQVRSIIDGIRTRLQADLDTQLDAIHANHEQALDTAREAASAAADTRWAAKMDQMRVELTSRMHAEVAAARSEVERTMVAEAMRVRVEAEQAAAEAAATAHREFEETLAVEREDAKADAAAAARIEIDQAVASERERAKADAASAARAEIDHAVNAERERAKTAADAAARIEIDHTVSTERERAKADAAAAARTEIDHAIASERERAEQAIARERERSAHELTEGRAALDAARASAMREIEEARGAGSASSGQPLSNAARNTAGLLSAVRAIDEAPSLSAALAAAVRGAAADAPRVVLFIVNGTQLQEWPVDGVPALHSAPIASDSPEAGVIGEALRRNETMRSGRHGGPGAPAFAGLPANRRAVAVPLVLTGRAVAVLYADEGPSGEGSSDWQETVQILGRHAAACIAHLTAARTAQAAQTMMGMPDGAQAPRADDDDAHGARRYARLLVSEIKMDNEVAVQQGRERRDLSSRLKPEIDRARRLYDQRVAPSVQARASLFQQELVQTLADGDHSLLG